MSEKQYKRLYKSESNRVFSGVLGGLGEYFEIDPVLVRVIYLAFTIFSGVIPGLIGYFVFCDSRIICCLSLLSFNR